MGGGTTFQEYLDDPERKAMRERLANDPSVRDAIIRSTEGYRLRDLAPSEVESGRQKKMEKPSTLMSTQSGSLTGLEKLQSPNITDIAGDSKKESGKRIASDDDAKQVRDQANVAKRTSLENREDYKEAMKNLGTKQQAIIKLLSEGKTDEEIRS